GHGVDRAKIAKSNCVRTAGGCLREADRFERALDGWQEVSAAGQHLFGGAGGPLPGAASRRDEAHTHRDQAEIRLACYLDAIGVQGDLAAAAKCEPGRSHDRWDTRIPRSEERR